MEYTFTVEKGYTGNGFSLKRELTGTYHFVHGLPMGAAVCYTVRIGGCDFEVMNYNDDVARKNLMNRITSQYRHLQSAKETDDLLSGQETVLNELSDLLVPV